MKQIILQHGCSCSAISVHPANWKTKKASLNITWYLQYRFYDKENNRSKLCIIKDRINQFKALELRKEYTASLLQNELELLQSGYNPITKNIVEERINVFEIEPTTPLLTALKQAADKIKCVHKTRLDLKNTIKFFEEAAFSLRMHRMPVEKVRRKHIKMILSRCEINKKEKWSNNTFNAYVKNLRILFEELMEYEATDTNPCEGIKRKKVIPQPKTILNKEECKLIDEFVAHYDYRFWRLIHIFFHSGSRTTELFRVQGKHVDLVRQKVKYLILKGKEYEWKQRTIKDIALPLWKDIMKDCKENDYVFSVGLEPGPKPIRPDQVQHRWRRHIQGKKEDGKLGIKCSWYSLKHLNTEQTAKLVGLKIAADQNAHSSTIITMKHYAIGEKERMHEQAKQVNNKFN